MKSAMSRFDNYLEGVIVIKGQLKYEISRLEDFSLKETG